MDSDAKELGHVRESTLNGFGVRRIYIVAIGNNLGGWLWSDVDFLTIGEINGWRQNDLITFFDT
jgi:hypothetical protein